MLSYYGLVKCVSESLSVCLAPLVQFYIHNSLYLSLTMLYLSMLTVNLVVRKRVCADRCATHPLFLYFHKCVIGNPQWCPAL